MWEFLNWDICLNGIFAYMGQNFLSHEKILLYEIFFVKFKRFLCNNYTLVLNSKYFVILQAYKWKICEIRLDGISLICDFLGPPPFHSVSL